LSFPRRFVRLRRAEIPWLNATKMFPCAVRVTADKAAFGGSPSSHVPVPRFFRIQTSEFEFPFRVEDSGAGGPGSVALVDFEQKTIQTFLELHTSAVLVGRETPVDVVAVYQFSVDPCLDAVVAADEEIRFKVLGGGHLG
jgi:hypothetical protein